MGEQEPRTRRGEQKAISTLESARAPVSREEGSEGEDGKRGDS